VSRGDRGEATATALSVRNHAGTCAHRRKDGSVRRLDDAAEVKIRAGCSEEQEDIEPIRISFDAAAEMLTCGGFHNSTAIIALQWLILNREKLPDIFGLRQGNAGI
jgi:hypothetical protein